MTLDNAKLRLLADGCEATDCRWHNRSHTYLSGDGKVYFCGVGHIYFQYNKQPSGPLEPLNYSWKFRG